MLARSAQRLSPIFFVFCLLFASVQPAVAQENPDPAQAVANAVVYLQAQQQPDGGILGFAGTSDPDTTIRTLLALVVNGQDLASFTSPEGNTLLKYLESQAASYVYDPNGLLFPGRAGLLLSAVALGGGDAHAFGEVDLAAELAASFQPDMGAYATEAALDYSSGAASDLNQAWAILGLALAGQPIPTAATFYLAGTQAEDGSWAGGDPDTTALALTALLASQNVLLDDPMIVRALQFFKSTQLANGGWKPGWDPDPLNADTTGWTAQALVSASDPASSVPWQQAWAAAQGDPVSALLSLVKEDGSIGGTYVNAYSTADALIGLAQTPLYFFASPESFQRAGLVVQNGDGSLFTACLSFTEESITGFELLNRSGLEIASVTDPSLGTAVCGIGVEGCPSSDCFCGMPNYWSYWQQGEGDWAYAISGAEQSVVQDGTLEAWSWGEGAPPALLTFEQVCQPGSVQPASVAALSQSSAPAYPEPVAPTEAAAVESYPEPAPTQPVIAADYPEPQSPTQTAVPIAYPEPSTEAPGFLSGFSPYLILGGLLVGLVIGLVVVARRKK